jgi:ATP phosphoribosyltransferase regulatory subunit HisZ
LIFEHEIPSGAKLYFGESAKLKRNIENIASEILSNNEFEEILTPNFSFSQHQSIDNERELINLNNEKNQSITLRADSTLDVVRIISKRLGRSTTHKKWFYIQPVFKYPATEVYQIGAEWIENINLEDILNLLIKLILEFKN